MAKLVTVSDEATGRKWLGTTAPSGGRPRLVVAGPDGAPCCCGGGPCHHYWRAHRCPLPGCVSHDVIYVCVDATTTLPDMTQPRPVRSGDVILDMGHCWVVEGDAGGRFVRCPPNTPPPQGFVCLPENVVTVAGPVVRAPLGCADPLCPGLCYIPGQFCPGQTVPTNPDGSEVCVVFPAQDLADWFALGNNCAVRGVPTPGYNGGFTCFIAQRGAPPVDSPGRCVVLRGPYLRSCCACAAGRDQCVSTVFSPRTYRWFHSDPECNAYRELLLPQTECCCDPTRGTLTIDASGQSYQWASRGGVPFEYLRYTIEAHGTKYRSRRDGPSLVHSVAQFYDENGNPDGPPYITDDTSDFAGCVVPSFLLGLGSYGGYACGIGSARHSCTEWALSISGSCWGQDPPGTPCRLGQFPVRTVTRESAVFTPDNPPGGPCLACAQSSGRIILPGGGGGLRGFGPGGLL